MLNYQDFVFRDFSQGITDNYININPNQYEEGDNLFIKEDGSYESRYGSTPIYNADIQARFTYMTELNDEIFAYRLSNIFLFDPVAQTLTPPDRPQSSAPIFQNTNGFFNITADEWQDHLIIQHSGNELTGELNRGIRVYRDGSGDLQLQELGMPDITGAQLTSITFDRGDGQLFVYNPVSPVPPANAGTFAHRYSYAFLFSLEYTQDENARKVFGPVRTTNVLYTNTAIGPNSNERVRIQNLPVLDVNGTQYDGTSVTLEIYRTGSNDSNYFKVAEVPNGQTSIGLGSEPVFFNGDVVTDEAIPFNEPIYNSGGTLDRFPAPKAKIIKVVNNTPYWGFVADETSGEVKPFRVLQGFAGVIDSHHPSAFFDADDDIVGIHGVNSFPIIFTRSFVYRLEGAFDITGAGSVRPRTISETAGCASHNCIVSARNALYWIGDNAVYVTNGYDVDKVPTSIQMLETIRSFTDTEEKRRLAVGQYDEDNERIIWAVSDSGGDNNRWLVLNLNTGGFTTASGPDFVSASILHTQGVLYRGDDLGYIYSHDDNDTADPNRDTSKPITQWGKRHVPWRYKSVQLDFGDPSITNWVSTISTKIESETNFGVLVGTDNDDGRVVRFCKEIRSWGNFIWGDADFVWADDDIVWGKSQSETFKRHVPRGTSRSKSRQIIMQPADVILYKSDTYGVADITYTVPTNPTSADVTLSSGKDWPRDLFGYKIAFEDDNYTKQYVIESVNSSTIRISGAIPQTGVKWQITGKFKDAKVNVKSYTIRAAGIENEGTEYKDGGGNV